jgi:hypothetical protein
MFYASILIILVCVCVCVCVGGGEYKSDNFHVHTVHLDNYQSFSSTDAQLDSLKNNFRFALKFT